MGRKKQKARRPSNTGSMMKMRAGFKGMSGGKRRRGKPETKFYQIMGWLLTGALVLFLVYSFR